MDKIETSQQNLNILYIGIFILLIFKCHIKDNSPIWDKFCKCKISLVPLGTLILLGKIGVVVPSSYPDKKIPIKNWCFWDFRERRKNI